MSTKYAIFDREVEREEHGHAIFDEDYDNFIVIGYTHGFTAEGEVIQKHLKDDTPVYAINNDTEVRTIQDLRKYYNK